MNGYHFFTRMPSLRPNDFIEARFGSFVTRFEIGGGIGHDGTFLSIGPVMSGCFLDAPDMTGVFYCKIMLARYRIAVVDHPPIHARAALRSLAYPAQRKEVQNAQSRATDVCQAPKRTPRCGQSAFRAGGTQHGANDPVCPQVLPAKYGTPYAIGGLAAQSPLAALRISDANIDCSASRRLNRYANSLTYECKYLGDTEW